MSLEPMDRTRPKRTGSFFIAESIVEKMGIRTMILVAGTMGKLDGNDRGQCWRMVLYFPGHGGIHFRVEKQKSTIFCKNYKKMYSQWS